MELNVLIVATIAFLAGYISRWRTGQKHRIVLFTMLILLHQHSKKLTRKNMIHILEMFENGKITYKKLSNLSKYIHKNDNLHIIKQP